MIFLDVMTDHNEVVRQTVRVELLSVCELLSNTKQSDLLLAFPSDLAEVELLEVFAGLGVLDVDGDVLSGTDLADLQLQVDDCGRTFSISGSFFGAVLSSAYFAGSLMR